MAAMLYEYVPDYGVPDDPKRVGTLYEGLIFEFKAVEYLAKNKRLGFRIAFFFDGPLVVVCTNAFYKGAKTPPDQVTLAKAERERYFRDKAVRQPRFENWRP